MGIVVRHVLFLWMFFLFTVIACAKQRISFQWMSCGNSSDSMTIETLEVYRNSSDEIFVSGKANVKSDIESPISGKLEIMKKVLFWVPIPCIDNFGTCKYSDICLFSPYKTDCPKIYEDNKLPCHCPIPGGTYLLDSFPININILPSWIEKGLYSIKLVLTSADKRILCLKMILDL